PGGNLGGELRLGGNAPFEALAAQHSDLDLDHVEPAGVLGDIVELQPAQHASRFSGGEGLVERTSRVRRQIIEHDPDAVGFWKVDVGELAHAGGEVDGGTAVGDFDFAPGPMHVEEDEQVGRS